MQNYRYTHDWWYHRQLMYIALVSNGIWWALACCTLAFLCLLHPFPTLSTPLYPSLLVFESDHLLNCNISSSTTDFD